LLILNQGQLLFDGSRADLEAQLPKRLLEIRVMGAIDRFRTALLEELRRPDLSLERGKIRVELRPDEPAATVLERVLQLARDHGATIEGVNSMGRQLEDAYLKLITDDEFRGFLRAAKT
jgi:hypothetical protein